MTDRLFVYGTLALTGRTRMYWPTCQASGSQPRLGARGCHKGGGAAIGYPGIFLDERADEVHGFVFSSDALAAHWPRLGAFEGEGNERVLTSAKLPDGSLVEAHIHRLSDNPTGGSA